MTYFVILPSTEIKIVAFDLGGVLAYQDLTILTDEEKSLLDIYQKYMGKKVVNKNDKEFLEYAKSRMSDITLKINKLDTEALYVLEGLQKEKINVSIWTNNTPYLNTWLEEVGMLKYVPLENIINSYYLGYDKPNKLFYLNALKALQISASQVLFLDDSTKNLESARNCGIESVQYNVDISLKDTLDKFYKRLKQRKIDNELQRKEYEKNGNTFLHK